MIMNNLYKYFAHLFIPMTSLNTPFPKNIQIQTSNKCNAACTFCPYPQTEGKKSFQMMDWNLYQIIINECSSRSVMQILPFFLNEPLLNKELTKYIAYAKEKNPKSIIKIFTNGSLLTEERSRELLKSDIDEIIISFNGSTKEEYENEMKQLKFDTTVERVSKLINLRGFNSKPEIAIHMLKLGYPEGSYEKIRDFWNGLGVAVHIYKYENRAGNVEEYTAYSMSGAKKVPCERLMQQIYIMVNGDVVLCCADWKNEVILGNVNNQSIYEVWNGKKRMTYLKAHEKGEFLSLKLCNSCNFNETRVD